MNIFFLFCSFFVASPVLASPVLDFSKSFDSGKSFSSGHVSLFFKNSSKKSYLLHQVQQRQLKNKKTLALKQRQSHLKKIREQRALKNKVEELEYQSYIQPDKIAPLNQKLSREGEAYWKHQNKLRLIEVARKKAFRQYKREYQNYEKRKRAVLQARLKTTQTLRQKLKPLDISPF